MAPRVKDALLVAPAPDELGPMLGPKPTLALRDRVEHATHAGTWRLDLDTGQLDWSPGMFNAAGIEAGSVGRDLAAVSVGLMHPDDRQRVEELMLDARDTGAIPDYEYRIIRPDGEIRTMAASAEAEFDADARPVALVGCAQDVTETRDVEQVIDARLRLLHFAASHSLGDLLQETLDEAETMTSSLIGFYHFVDDGEEGLTLQNWSTRTKHDFCKAAGRGLHYPVSQAGVWVDCVRQRDVVIHNDYESLTTKRGLPEGHAPVVRELVVPVLRDGSVRAILGVGNKQVDYTARDVEVVSALADFAWEIAERKRTEEELEENRERNTELTQTIAQGVVYHDANGKVTAANPAACRILGLSMDEITERFALDNGFQMIREDGSRLPSREHPAVLALSTGCEVRGVPIGIVSPGHDDVVWLLVDAVPRFRAESDEPFEVQSTFTDITEIKRAESELASSFEQLEVMYEETIATIGNIAELRDPYTAGHQKRVGKLAAVIGRRMGLDDDAVRGLLIAGTVHDIGKMTVPAETLSRPGKLSDTELELVRTHTSAGSAILGHIDFPWPVAAVALQHHERLDGSGYPEGLAGDQILLEARIMAVADVVEAMSSHRPYRPALGVDAALEEITRGRGSVYDPDAVDACVAVIREDRFLMEPI